MSIQNHIKDILSISQRECGFLLHNRAYRLSMIGFPLLVIVFFLTLMNEGVPTKLPAGIVDLDNTTTSRAMIRQLNAFQTTNIVNYYNNVDEARNAIQKNEIYAFLYIPKGFSKDLIASRQPTISYYYSNISLAAGSLLMRDMTVVTTLGKAKVGITKLAALGNSNNQIATFLQPIVVDSHQLQNPWTNYDVYLSHLVIPGEIMLFVMLVSTYSLGCELKFKRSRELMAKAHGSILKAVLGKLLPQFISFLSIFYIFFFIIYGVCDYPHENGVFPLLLLGFLAVLSAQGFGVMMFSIAPSMRMSMSMCCLWGILSFSLIGTAYPVPSMSPIIKSLSVLFPLRHYYLIFDIGIFNGFPLHYCWKHILALVIFALAPMAFLWNMKRSYYHDVYLE